MSNWDLGVVTDAGVTLLNKIEAGTASAVIDTIVIGSGIYNSTEKALISRRTALKNQQLSATINTKRFPDASTLEIKASIDNTTVVTGFDITECGVYATVTEGGVTSTLLFAVAYTETPDYMTAYGGDYPQIVIEDVYLPISNTASVSVTITAGAYALSEDLTDHEAEIASKTDHGHAIIIDDLTHSSYADGEVLSAYQGYLLKQGLDKAYKSDDTADTDIADGDYFPYYDTSATQKKRTLWSTILGKLKNIFPLGSTLAPIANGPKYPANWSAGKKFVYQGQLCKTKVNVTTSDNISVGSSGNAELDSDITSQINGLMTAVSNIKSSISDALETKTVELIDNAITLSNKQITYNKTLFEMRGYLNIPAGTYTCNVNYNDKWHVALCYLTITDAEKIWKNIASFSNGTAVAGFLAQGTNGLFYTISFIKYSANSVQVICNGLRSDVENDHITTQSDIKIRTNNMPILIASGYQYLPIT